MMRGYFFRNQLPHLLGAMVASGYCSIVVLFNHGGAARLDRDTKDVLHLT